MGSNYTTVRLDEIASNISRPFPSKNKNKAIFVNTGDVLEGSFLHQDYSDVASLPGQAKKAVLKGDILFSEIRPGNGRYARVNFETTEDFVVSTKFMVIELNTELMEDDYFYLQLTSRETLAEFQRIAESRSGTFPQITFDSISHHQFYCPEKETQKKISSSLATLNEKIELNRQTNQTLEQMAQALFKSWFVDFDPVIDNALAAGNKLPDELAARVAVRQRAHKLPNYKPLPADIQKLFPNEFEQTDDLAIGIEGWIPKGWKLKTFESIIELIGGGTPKTSVDEYWNGDIPWFSVVDAPNDSDIFVIDTEKHITELGVKNSSTKLLRTGTTIISARGTVGKCALVGEKMAMNQSCYGINGIEGISDEYIYFLTRYQVSDLQKRGHGSVFNTITRETFKSINIVFSGTELTKKYSELVKPYLLKVLLNNKQNKELVKSRDTLLPKLISGEITINKDTSNESLG